MSSPTRAHRSVPPRSDRPVRKFDDTMSDKQIAGSVRFGRMVTFHVLDQEPVTGYVAGMDKFNYLVVTPIYDDKTKSYALEKFLVHKGSTPLIELHDDSTIDTEVEEARELLQRMVKPFRNLIMPEFFPNVPRNSDRNTDDEDPFPDGPDRM